MAAGTWSEVLPHNIPFGALLTLPGASFLADLHEMRGLRCSSSGYMTVFLVVGFDFMMLSTTGRWR